MRTILLPMLIAAAACATFGSGPDIKGRYEQGLDAFTAADYGTAISHLDWVGRLRADESIGQRASLLGVGAALDPRNPRRDFGAATAFAIRLRDSGDGWTVPLGEALRLLVTEVASAQARITDAESARDQAFSIASEQRSLLEKQLRAVAAERDALARRAATLEQTLAEREKQLKDKDQELERIRKIVRG